MRPMDEGQGNRSPDNAGFGAVVGAAAAGDDDGGRRGRVAAAGGGGGGSGSGSGEGQQYDGGAQQYGVVPHSPALQRRGSARRSLLLDLNAPSSMDLDQGPKTWYQLQQNQQQLQQGLGLGGSRGFSLQRPMDGPLGFNRGASESLQWGLGGSGGGFSGGSGTSAALRHAIATATASAAAAVAGEGAVAAVQISPAVAVARGFTGQQNAGNLRGVAAISATATAIGSTVLRYGSSSSSGSGTTVLPKLGDPGTTPGPVQLVKGLLQLLTVLQLGATARAAVTAAFKWANADVAVAAWRMLCSACQQQQIRGVAKVLQVR
jgi:hypothetical protein